MKTCRCGCLSPFRYSEFPRPSIFAGEPEFRPRNAAGASMSQITSKSVTAFEVKHGRSLGTVGGISDKADRETAERNDQRRLARKRKAA